MQYLTGVCFPQQTFTPAEWGQMFEAIMADGILRGCAVTVSGQNVYIAPGAMIIKGRLIEIPATVTEATNPTYANGYGQVKVCINTTNPSTTLLNQQAYVNTVYSSSQTFPALTQDDINGTGTLYEVELAILTYSSGSISASTQKLGGVFGASKLIASDANGRLSVSNVNQSYINTLTSNAQTQINTINSNINSLTTTVNGKQKAITYGTTDPTGGSNGDIYIKYS